MAEIHQLILTHGIDEARRQAASAHERAVVEAAYQVLAEETESIGFTYSGFALTSLPHKEQQEMVWRREGHNLTLVLQSGTDRLGKTIGLPYGSYARFILLFLQSEAVKTGSREIELGRSMQVWLGRMGLSIGGNSYRIVKEQAKRISVCRLTFFGMNGDQEVLRNGGFVEGAITMTGISTSPDQPSLWQDKVRLDEAFYKALREHPVPVSEGALKAIGPRSMSIDVYIWLAYRLHALKRDTDVSWSALYSQFGAGFKRLRAFRAQFLESLQLSLAAYPEARVTVSETGVTLHPSRPAIAKL
ncbi:replication protein RepA [Belnapia sp. F-4-1]|uniref:replication protein RepA n=1 Tax=Belnapia sp. F-4-1 TaxID=1545443 RepID=UPI0005BC8484|nr:replication protein RepA [Belnapia sp. F-4-1]